MDWHNCWDDTERACRQILGQGHAKPRKSDPGKLYLTCQNARPQNACLAWKARRAQNSRYKGQLPSVSLSLVSFCQGRKDRRNCRTRDEADHSRDNYDCGMTRPKDSHFQSYEVFSEAFCIFVAFSPTATDPSNVLLGRCSSGHCDEGVPFVPKKAAGLRRARAPWGRSSGDICWCTGEWRTCYAGSHEQQGCKCQARKVRVTTSTALYYSVFVSIQAV